MVPVTFSAELSVIICIDFLSIHCKSTLIGPGGYLDYCC